FFTSKKPCLHSNNVRQVTRNKLVIQIRIDKKQVVFGEFDILANLIEIIKNHSMRDGDICRSYRLHPKILSRVMQQYAQLAQARTGSVRVQLVEHINGRLYRRMFSDVPFSEYRA